MNFSENFENARNFATAAAQAAREKAKQMAAIAKANISIYTEEDKVKKAEQQLGRLYYRDYAVDEERDEAEYLPWCRKIDESKVRIAELRAYIEKLRSSAETEMDANEPSEADFADAEPKEQILLEPAQNGCDGAE